MGARAIWAWVKLPKAVALIAFALPWLTVSCSTTVLVCASGWSLATGRVTVVDPLTGAAEVQAGQPNMLLVTAFAVVAIGLLSSFLGRSRAIVVLVTALAALVMVLVATHRIDAEARREAIERRARHSAVPPIGIAWQAGFWLEVAALAAAAGLSGAVVLGRDRFGARALGEDDRTRR